MTDSALSDLPESVRARVVALTADVLPDVVRLPAAVRRVASFAPARRAKAGASVISAAFDGAEGEEFREHVAASLSVRYAGGSAGDAPPAERAALAWLLRPEGWARALAAVLEELASAAGPTLDAEVERLRARLAATEDELRDLRTDRKGQVEELKAENATLRRKLGEARGTVREAGVERDEAKAAQTRAEDQVAERDRILRQLRGQVARLESDLGTQRRAVRSERDDASLRARFLLDTLLDAANGLRRELALPPIQSVPGERVESELAEAGEPARGATVASSAHAEQYLAMPRARLIVDGYNVSKTLWSSSPLAAQRTRLLQALAPLVARTGAETTVVFDAAASTTRPVVSTPRGVKVIFSPEGVIADDVIRDLVAAEPSGRVILVVTDDAEIVRDVRRDGARSVSVLALAGLLG